MILAVNTSFPEMNQLAAGLAEAGLLSTYVRPYANFQRKWERNLESMPWLGKVYSHTFGRRVLPQPLTKKNVRETGVILDFLMSAHGRLPSTTPDYRRIRRALMDARTNAVAKTAAKVFSGEPAVVASWGCAEYLFRTAKTTGSICVLNYPLAHHRFTRRFLLEEAERQPDFADTLNSLDLKPWFEQRLDTEIELADYILVGSSFARDSFIAEGIPPEKLVVIPYGADLQLFEPIETPRAHNQKLRLLFVGQVTQRKGLSYLLQAMQQLGINNYTLTIVGQMQGSARILNPHRYLFQQIPHVPQTELRELYRQADIFVFPTLVEGMGLVVLEAMASGLPVITTPNGPGDIVRDGIDGFLIPPRNVSAIVDRVEYLRAHQNLRFEMGQNARSRALQFTLESYRGHVVKLLRSWIGVEEENEYDIRS
ncbi:MAG: glycosyltransferase family 4 protein [Firmicutes bacterium]|nr:glycosyltransferase family 4 protein [Bacillota bacterium]